MDRLEAVHLYVAHLFDCRADGRFDALEDLLGAWKRGASSKEFLALGERLTSQAEHRREPATVIYLADRLRQKGFL